MSFEPTPVFGFAPGTPEYNLFDRASAATIRGQLDISAMYTEELRTRVPEDVMNEVYCDLTRTFHVVRQRCSYWSS